MKNVFVFVIMALISCSCTDVREKEKASQAAHPRVHEQNNVFTLQYGPLRVIVDATAAGKMSGLYWDSLSFLSDTSAHPDNWGNSLWPSPQRAWGWPPSIALDKAPYQVLTDTGYVELKSSKDSLLGLVFIKRYSIETKDTSLHIRYTILNSSTQERRVAAWEISRVAPKGLTLFPMGELPWKGDLSNHISLLDSIVWFDYTALPIPSGVPKLFASGKEGWMAQIGSSGIIIKKFTDILPLQYAPDEAEIELYANPDGSYIEIEQQGPYTTLAPGAQLTYEVQWYVRPIPSNIHVSKGNRELVNWIRNRIK
ncbi:MAG: DUF4380 domain-containing protein [Cytophagaceae bacterium]|jgi:hypothetical protein|nr:DUF4380 domain-containing protein [Cytophagaceae bacterium]